MSEQVLVGPLLDFGTTYWGSTLMREEHKGLWAKGFEPTGRFGIGFFSVFMWGHRVSVTSRRYEDAQRDTRVLEFRTGLDTRPMVRLALPAEQLRDGGTRVRVWLNKDPRQEGGLLLPRHDPYGGELEPEDLGALCAWLAPALEVDLYVKVGESSRRMVAASDWLTMDGRELFARVSRRRPVRQVSAFGSFLQIIDGPDKHPLGRAAIFHTGGISGLEYPRSPFGIITVGGLRVNEVEGIAGVLVGCVERAARDWAVPLVRADELATWSSKQAKLIHESVPDPRLQLTCAASVLAYGGDPGELPIAKRGSEFVNREALAQREDAPEEIVLFPFHLDHLMIADGGLSLHPNVLGIYEMSGINLPRQVDSRSPVDLIMEALAIAWGCTPEELRVSHILQEYEVGSRGGEPQKSWEVRIIHKRKPRPPRVLPKSKSTFEVS